GSVVEGSVRLAKNRMRIAVQLTDAKTEQTLWSSQYDRSVDDVFAVQTDVALRIAEALQAKLSPDERNRVQQVPTQNAAAHDLYLRARKLNTFSREENERSIALLKQAVDLDPRFVAAIALISYRMGFLHPDMAANLDEAIRWAQRALAIDPNSSSAHVALATNYGNQGVTSKARIDFR